MKTNSYRKVAGCNPSQEGADASAGRNESEQAAALLTRIDFRHETPEDGHNEQVKDTDPNKENATKPDVI